MSSIKITELGSSLNYDSWIAELVSVKQDNIDTISTSVSSYDNELSALSSIETDFDDFLNSLETFTDALSNADVFNQKAATSSASSTVSASVTSSSTAQDQEITMSVSQLATATKAKSAYTVGAEITGSTLVSAISNGSVNSGSFSVYVNNTKYSITVTTSESLDTAVSDLNKITGVKASISDGKLTIASSDSNNYSLSIGSSADTSNFSDVMSLNTNSTTSASSYTSSKTIFTTDASAALTSTAFQKVTTITTESSTTTSTTATSVTAGTFYVNGLEFTISTSKTMTALCNEITKSKAGVTATWDSNAGKLTILSSDTGAVNVDIEAGTSNFTDVMGLTSSTWNSDGSLASTSLLSGSQKLGNNAIFTINGTKITSSSNTVTADISGIKGVSLNLSAVTSSDVTITIGSDYSSAIDAMGTLVSTYNTLMTDTDTATGTDGYLHGDSTLKYFRSSIRSLVSQVLSSSGTYSTLSSIGLTTGSIGESSTEGTNQLYLNTTVFQSALEKDASSVKKLLEGSGSTSGIFDMMKSVVEKATDSHDGYFTVEEKSIENKISKLNDKIESMNEDLETYEDQLYSKYNAMDSLIASYKSELTTFQSYFGSTSSSS